MGGGMYGRPYGMGGGYGMGMYGMGGMGMGGMYGNQGNMQNRPFLERMSAYVYQLCEIAQMVEFNANGLYAFSQLMKNLSIGAVKFSKEWLWWLIQKSVELFKDLREWTKQKFRDYFLKKDLTQDEL